MKETIDQTNVILYKTKKGKPMRAIEKGREVDDGVVVTTHTKVIIHKILDNRFAMVEYSNGRLSKALIWDLKLNDSTDPEWFEEDNRPQKLDPLMQSLEDSGSREGIDFNSPFVITTIFKGSGKWVATCAQNLNSVDVELINQNRGFVLLERIKDNHHSAAYLVEDHVTTAFGEAYLYILEGFNLKGAFHYAVDKRGDEK